MNVILEPSRYKRQKFVKQNQNDCRWCLGVSWATELVSQLGLTYQISGTVGA